MFLLIIEKGKNNQTNKNLSMYEFQSFTTNTDTNFEIPSQCRFFFHYIDFPCITFPLQPTHFGKAITVGTTK
jgi:hypothetical protein